MFEHLQRLGAEIIHAGRSASFGGEKLNVIIESYFSCQNVMPDLKEWFPEFYADQNDPYANQDWQESGCRLGPVMGSNRGLEQLSVMGPCVHIGVACNPAVFCHPDRVNDHWHDLVVGVGHSAAYSGNPSGLTG